MNSLAFIYKDGLDIKLLTTIDMQPNNETKPNQIIIYI